MRYLSANTRNSPRRAGIVLLVVIAMLTLFAVVALSFVFYAEAEAVAAQVNRQAQTQRQSDLDVEALAGFFLGQLIYPTDNIYSALRGHELARSIYGYNPAVLNYTPYNGIGRTAYAPPGENDVDLAISRYAMINYQTFWDPTQAANNRTVNFVRTPEYYDKFFFGNVPGTAPPSPAHLAVGGQYRYVGGANPPWTYFDANNMYLAAVMPDGTISKQSFVHPSINAIGAGTVAGRYTSLRPDPLWNPQFVTPDSDPGGDVKNLEGAKGISNGAGGFYNNDSIWVDLGHPVMTGPDGKRYKPLFAFLVTDLSNRLHLWAHGNRIGGTPAAPSHVSNQGFGPPEVNLSRVLTDPNELQALFNLKYGGLAGTAASLPAGSPVPYNPGPWYARYDFDGLDPAIGRGSYPMFTAFSTTSTAATAIGAGVTMPVSNASSTTAAGFPWAIQAGMILNIDTGLNAEKVTVTSVNIPGNSFVANFTIAHAIGVQVALIPNSPPVLNATFFAFPSFPTTGWDNGNASEVTQKPLGFNPWMANGTNIGPLPLSNMEALLRFGGTGSPWVTSEIFRIMPNTFSNVSTRNLVTLWNPHLDRITASPVISWDPDTAGNYRYTGGPGGYPRFYPMPIPTPAFNTPSAYPPKSEFTADWRSNLGTQLRVNLNRPLANYPDPTPGTKVIDTSTPAALAAYVQALSDRQQLAKDIYAALVRVTGAQDPNTAPIANVSTTSDDYTGARWLAQLAVNIVDYIDNDDYCTPFYWNAQAAANSTGTIAAETVFGTELPRLVLNEALALYDNDPNDPLIATMMKADDTKNRLNLWAELHNPFKTTPGVETFPRDGGAAILKNTAVATPFDIYQLVAARKLAADTVPLATVMRDPANNLGDPDFTAPVGALRVLRPFAGWGLDAATRQVLPANGAMSSPLNAQPLAAAVSVVGTEVTFQTGVAHGFFPGQTVVIAGFTAPNTGFNGSYVIKGPPIASLTTFKVDNPNPGLPGGGAFAPAGSTATVGRNNGFVVLGPNAANATTPGTSFLPTRDPNLPTTFSNGSMSIVNPPGGPPAGLPSAIGPVTLVLRRLTNPHLPPNNTPGSATYNPYITVDYMPVSFIRDNRLYDANGLNAANPGPVTGFSSIGRKQPYAAHGSQVFAQTASPVANQPKNSFFSHNDVRETPFTWLTHLDRPLVNQLELLHVSGFKPHELTQQFITSTPLNPGGSKFQHYAPWGHLDSPYVGGSPASLIYRALDLLGTPNNMLGNLRGGRWQGNVNLNTVMDPRVLWALADPQDVPPPPSAYYAFTTGEVFNIFSKIMNARNPAAGFVFPGEGKPFKSFAAGDINDTFLRPLDPPPALSTQSLFAVGAATNHPYQRNTLLQKIFNNVTTTSNTFVVWTTVGFFEVVDESVRPPRLGAEIGRSENRHIRHRFFAIVDRSGLQIYNTGVTAAVAVGANQTMTHDLADVKTGSANISAWNNTQGYFISNTVSYLGSAYYCIQPNTNIVPTNTANWLPILQPGMLLEIIDPLNVNSEVVAVKTVAGNTFTADFTKPHIAGERIICRGNPGPKTNFNAATPTVPAYNPRQDTNVVLHLSVIQ